MHFIDPKELGGLHVIGRKDVTPLSAAERDDRSLRIPYSAQELRDAPHRTPVPAEWAVPCLHEHAMPSANQMS